MHLIYEAFGGGGGGAKKNKSSKTAAERVDLYADVLQCARDADAAGLRKAYYRRALQYHPDKSTEPNANLLFQAISLAYQILKDPETRVIYDETGELPDAPDDYNDDDLKTGSGASQWKAYFDQIFGKVTTSDIDAFAQKYKCSDEERRDVLKEFEARKGNLVKMLDFVMLSEPLDAVRWVEDYIRPALELKHVPASYKQPMEKSLALLQKKIQQQQSKEQESEPEEEEETDTDETVSENDDLSPPSKKKKAKASGKNVTPKKASSKTTPAKGKSTKKRKSDDSGSMTDLIAQIQNKNRAGSSQLLSNLSARYGVDPNKMKNDQDPLDDEEFAKIQARLSSNSSNKKKKTTTTKAGRR